MNLIFAAAFLPAADDREGMILFLIGAALALLAVIAGIVAAISVSRMKTATSESADSCALPEEETEADALHPAKAAVDKKADKKPSDRLVLICDLLIVFGFTMHALAILGSFGRRDQ